MEVLISEPFYAFLFIGLGLVFLFLEVFIPTGGILGILSLGCISFGIFGLFHQGRSLLALAALAGSALAVILGIRFGLRRLSFTGSMTPEVSTSVDHTIEKLVGKQGVAHTPLRPAGVAIIDGKKVDVVTRGDFLQRDAAVEVLDTEGNRVVVRALPVNTGQATAHEAGSDTQS